MPSFTVEGFAATREYLRHRPQVVERVHCRDASVRERLRSALGEGFPAELVDVGSHSRGRRSDLSATVRLEPRDSRAVIASLEAEAPPLVMALDHLTDPRNLGAIVRSAAFFGIPYLLLPRDRQVGLTEAAVATAQGGFALVDLVPVVNLARALRSFQEHGYWVVGTAVEGEDYREVAGFYERTVVVVGNEEKGISAGVAKVCDRQVTIPAAGKSLDSLNVAVAAGFSPADFIKTLARALDGIGIVVYHTISNGNPHRSPLA